MLIRGRMRGGVNWNWRKAVWGYRYRMMENQMEDDMVTEVVCGNKPSTCLCCMPWCLAKVTRGEGRSSA